MSRIRRAEPVSVVIESAGAAPVAASLGEIVPAADPASRTFMVKLDLPPGLAVRSGMFGRASFPLGTRMALAVPAGAIVERGQLAAVYVLDTQGIARLRIIKVGRRMGTQVEVLSGLTAGERIVLSNPHDVVDGSRVEAQNG
jgi:membrane fusion protein, multidrug efflux system